MICVLRMRGVVRSNSQLLGLHNTRDVPPNPNEGYSREGVVATAEGWQTPDTLATARTNKTFGSTATSVVPASVVPPPAGPARATDPTRTRSRGKENDWAAEKASSKLLLSDKPEVAAPYKSSEGVRFVNKERLKLLEQACLKGGGGVAFMVVCVRE